MVHWVISPSIRRRKFLIWNRSPTLCIQKAMMKQQDDDRNPFHLHCMFLCKLHSILLLLILLTCIISQRNTFVKTFTLYTPKNLVFFCQPVYNYPV